MINFVNKNYIFLKDNYINFYLYFVCIWSESGNIEHDKICGATKGWR